METKKEILKVCMSKGFLLDKEILDLLSNFDTSVVEKVVEKIEHLNISERMITKALFFENIEKISEVLKDGKSKKIVEKFFITLGYSRMEIEETEENQKEVQEENEGIEKGGVKILNSQIIPPKKVTVKDFVSHFRSRYDFMKKVLESKGLENLTSLRKITNARGNYTVIVSVLSKRVTKNKNLLLDVEDLTGSSRVLINKNKQDVYEKAKDILVDDIVAFDVSGSSEILFANNIIYPDTALQERKNGKDDVWVAFSSDLHIGSTMFLEKNVLKFIKWLNGAEGDEKQREIAKKVKYLFLTGDSVDGVGIFPGQDLFLNIKDIKMQYEKLVELLKLIRKDIKIIICPGQHDAVWVGEPQPIIGEDWASSLHKMENVVLTTNPSLVEIDDGFKILMYHGASMHGIIEEIPYIRLNHGHNSPTTVVKEMLKRRHLAPMHGACDYVPYEKSDPMVIRQVPDILATGDQHRSEVSIYNNILLISSSCWQSITPFEEKVGNNPDPCKVPLFNLKTREIKIMDFSDEDSKKTLEEREKESLEEKHREEVEEIKKKIEVKHG